MRPWPAFVTLILASCGVVGGQPTGEGTDADLTAGETLYQANCAECHGVDLRGTAKGPSPLSEVYEPSHHSDAAFHLAVRNGSPAHHWNFGDMEPVPGLDDEEIAAITAYVRDVQQREGLEPYPP